jgi:hypothetical protein
MRTTAVCTRLAVDLQRATYQQQATPMQIIVAALVLVICIPHLDHIQPFCQPPAHLNPKGIKVDWERSMHAHDNKSEAGEKCILGSHRAG